ncbi:flagellar hook assembly protein FlgD [Comamonas endophytica]|uniref:Basal-body rod modification protein FlgD n=1 Tax=Comamonas endophytica TaxID=2949090 RepID=A0ABY6GEL4_9BURK|nr:MULTISPECIES: flagellar hook capping FlgD N-terminal domain-containing protein [unclassified Acidovorax]MCD2512724.1 flagellar hook assembly protein FlgD [Acidovorax sp. D4N7]UYG52924.1 flagellar hook assembly protein FlgD [Acidovorax sp. 5MLIR]
MILNPVSGTGATANGASNAAASTDPAAQQDRFLKLLVAQLNNQDPMNPMDNAQMTTQMAQINTVVGINQLNSTMEAMSSQFTAMQVLQGTSMIGRTVLSEGNTLSTPVDKVSTAAFDLSGTAADVKVNITTAAGTVVDTVKLGALDAGRHYFTWDSSNYTGDVSALRFQVASTNGTANVANTPLAPKMVVATSTTDNALTLELENGESLAYNKVKAVF